MSIVINGTGTITGISQGGLNDNIITQSELANTGVAGNGPAFSAYPSVTQTFSAGTTTKILFDSEEYDTNSNFASSRFTPTVAGYYQVNAYMTAIYPSGESSLFVYKTGVPSKTFADAQGAYPYILGGSIVVYCNGSTDYLEIYTYTQNGFTNYATAVRTCFQASLIRAA